MMMKRLMVLGAVGIWATLGGQAFAGLQCTSVEGGTLVLAPVEGSDHQEATHTPLEAAEVKYAASLLNENVGLLYSKSVYQLTPTYGDALTLNVVTRTVVGRGGCGRGSCDPDSPTSPGRKVTTATLVNDVAQTSVWFSCVLN